MALGEGILMHRCRVGVRHGWRDPRRGSSGSGKKRRLELGR